LRVRIQPKRHPQGMKPAKRLNTSKLKNDEIKQQFVNQLRDSLETVSLDDQNIETSWKNLKDAIHSAALGTLGPISRNHKDWFDENSEEIQELLNKKHRLHRAYIIDTKDTSKKDAYTTIRNTIQGKLRKMRDTWLKNKADEIQCYADKHDLKKFYDGLKEIYGPSSTGLSPLLTADGNTLIKEDILKRWAEHFDNVLNRPSEINNEAIDHLPQVPIDDELAAPHTLLETQKAISQLSTGKSPGRDSISAEVYKEGGLAVSDKLHQLFIIAWELETIPQDATIIHLYKRKGNRQQERYLRGFSSIVSMVFAARQLQEKCQEQNCDLFSTYVDLTKAFDSVCREGLWKIMAKYGCPQKFIILVRQFHDGMQACVRDNDTLSDAFPVTNGVKQGQESAEARSTHGRTSPE
ncbi:hypothetical protein Bbelb_429670, partial [Branchiostoma belcheri]